MNRLPAIFIIAVVQASILIQFPKNKSSIADTNGVVYSAPHLADNKDDFEMFTFFIPNFTVWNILLELNFDYEDVRHHVAAFLWQHGLIFWLMIFGPVYVFTKMSFKYRAIFVGILFLVNISSYQSAKHLADEVARAEWDTALLPYNGFLLVKTPEMLYGVSNSFFNDYVFDRTVYKLMVPITYFSSLLESLKFDFHSQLFPHQKIDIVSEEHIVNYFFTTPAYRQASFSEESGEWIAGTRGYGTVGPYSDVPGLNVTFKEGRITSFNDRKGNLITRECSSWDLTKQLFWNSMTTDIVNHWHIATHFQFSYTYAAQTVIPKENSLRKILDTHNRYHSSIDFSASMAAFAVTPTVNRNYDPEHGEFTTPALKDGKYGNYTSWNYHILGLGIGRKDHSGYVHGTPHDHFDLSGNVQHAAHDHAQSKTFPPAYATKDSHQYDTPLGNYLYDQYYCFHDFVLEMNEQDKWFEDDYVRKFFEISAEVDASVQDIILDDELLLHFITTIIFEQSFVHSLDHRQIFNSYKDLSSWTWYHRLGDRLEFPACDDETPAETLLSSKTYLDWIKQYTFTFSFMDWNTWPNLVLSDEDFMMKATYGFVTEEAKKAREGMATCLRGNQASRKHEEIVSFLRHPLDEFSSSIQF